LWLAWEVICVERLTYDNALGLIGQTPLVRLGAVSPSGGAQVWAKAEFKNVAGSVKDRPALSMILAAEQSGELTKGGTVVEATSGNTGISLAMISAMRGYRCILVMPQDMSIERRYLLKAYGAQIELTDAALGMAGAVARAEEIAKDTPGVFLPKQFSNPNNVLAHERTTGPEILAQVPTGLKAFVAGVGTGGTLTGVGRALRAAHGNQVRLVAVEPERCAVLSGGKPGLHGIQGLGAGFVPAILDRALIDEVIAVGDVTAQRMVQRLAHEEGLIVGPSSGANVAAACHVAGRLESGIVVTVLCDTGERYLF
jgi:cysteine synthase A